jgi:hypothetical protein
MSRTPRSALTPYCRKPHRLADGVPLAHACRVLPREAICAVVAGDYDRAIRLLARAAASGPLPAHRGIWKTRRR